MATFSLGTVIDDIENTLDEAATLAASQTYDEITESIPETPMLQVYPEENNGTSQASETDRLSFNSDVSSKRYTILADYFALQRGPSPGETMKYLVDGIDDLEDILDAQSPSFFGNDDIEAFSWRWERVTFDYAGRTYVGARFYIVIYIY